jgi:hypothetical protein
MDRLQLEAKLFDQWFPAEYALEHRQAAPVVLELALSVGLRAERWIAMQSAPELAHLRQLVSGVNHGHVPVGVLDLIAQRLLALTCICDLVILGQAAHEPCDVAAKPHVDLLDRRLGLLQRVVQNRSCGNLVATVARAQQRRDLKRMQDERRAVGTARVRVVCADRKRKCCERYGTIENERRQATRCGPLSKRHLRRLPVGRTRATCFTNW